MRRAVSAICWQELQTGFLITCSSCISMSESWRRFLPSPAVTCGLAGCQRRYHERVPLKFNTVTRHEGTWLSDRLLHAPFTSSAKWEWKLCTPRSTLLGPRVSRHLTQMILKPWRWNPETLHVKGEYFINLLPRGRKLQCLTYTMVQSPSWEANWFAASQEILRISRNPKVHYRTQTCPPPVCILGQPNPDHIPTSHLLEIHPNIIHPSTPSVSHPC